MPAIDATNTSALKVRTFFRILALIVVLVSAAFGFMHRDTVHESDSPEQASAPGD